MSYNSEQARAAAQETAKATKELLDAVVSMHQDLLLRDAAEAVRGAALGDLFEHTETYEVCRDCGQHVFNLTAADRVAHAEQEIFRDYGFQGYSLRPSARRALIRECESVSRVKAIIEGKEESK